MVNIGILAIFQLYLIHKQKPARGKEKAPASLQALYTDSHSTSADIIQQVSSAGFFLSRRKNSLILVQSF
jgi:hypothetical protein